MDAFDATVGLFRTNLVADGWAPLVVGHSLNTVLRDFNTNSLASI